MSDARLGLRGLAGAVMALLLAAAPPPPSGAGTAPASAPAGNDRQIIFISPMGEPFRAPRGGPAPDQLWFHGADRNGDGRITLVEMRADAYRFFKTLDLNHDGEIDPEELQHYETDVAPEILDFRRSGPPGNGGTGGGDADGSPAGGRHRSADHSLRHGGEFAYFELPEPVAAADADMNRGVSAREFDAAAQKRFLLLDIAHEGYLSYAKLQDIRR